MKKHLHPHPQGDKGEGDLGPRGLATPPLAALGPVFDICEGACWFPFGSAYLVLTQPSEACCPLFQMRTLKFTEAQELGLKNQAKPKCPNLKDVDPQL